MPYREEGTFYLYGRAHNLQIGHLVLGNYKTPTHVPHCQIPLLSEDELSSWTTTAPISGIFADTQGWNIRAEVEVLKLAGSDDKVRDFFQEKVLPDKGVKEHLKRWLTVSRTRYVLSRFGPMRVPQIWCLTGLFELSDVTVATVVENRPDVTLGISSAFVTALSGVPVGGSFEIGRDFVITCDTKHPAQGVWAAQYQLINTRPALRIEGDDTAPIDVVKLYPDYTYAGGGVLGDEDVDEDVDDALELEVEDVDRDAPVDDFDEEYWEAYHEAYRITKRVNMLDDL